MTIAIAAVIFRVLPTTSFRDSFLGNWLATLSGIIIGVPVAIALNSWQQHQEENARRSKILGLLKNELDYNVLAMKNRMPEHIGGTQRQMPSEPLKDELWNAFSDGGELQWIKDLDLLDVLSTAYYRIRIVMFLEDAFHRETLFRDTIGSYKTLAYQFQLNDRELMKDVERALKEIEKRLVEHRRQAG